jgi:hypothetical protein
MGGEIGESKEQSHDGWVLGHPRQSLDLVGKVGPIQPFPSRQQVNRYHLAAAELYASPHLAESAAAKALFEHLVWCDVNSLKLLCSGAALPMNDEGADIVYDREVKQAEWMHGHQSERIYVRPHLAWGVCRRRSIRPNLTEHNDADKKSVAFTLVSRRKCPLIPGRRPGPSLESASIPTGLSPAQTSESL